MIGLGWDVRATDGQDFDLDASAFVLKADGKVRGDTDFCFYNNKDVGGAVIHQGDNRTGEGDGDDEQVKIILSKIPAELDKVAIAVTIHEGEQRGQSFGRSEEHTSELQSPMRLSYADFCLKKTKPRN